MPINTIKDQFPLLKKHSSLIYLDNAATTQKPQAVIDALVDYYTNHNANIHRGIYTFGEQATELYEQARATVAAFIGAQQDEIVFVKNATEGINLVAAAWGLHHIKSGDTIVLTEYEHHANLLPWQRLAQQADATVRIIPVHDDGTLDYRTLDTVITAQTKLVAFSAVSNVTGAHTDSKRIVDAAHKVGAKVLIDAAQLVAHEPVDVKQLDVDFMAFSGHKLFGPTGIGVLYIKKELQPKMVPYQVGGGVVFDVDWQHTHYAQGPHRFEAGTPPIAQAIGLAAAVDWLKQQNFTAIAEHERSLMHMLVDGLERLPGIKILGPIEQLKHKGHLVSFIVDGVHAHDVAAFLNQAHVAVRAGHHCAQPLAKRLNVDASVRVSLACYTTKEDIQRLLDALNQLT